MKIQFKRWSCTLTKSKYQNNNRIALQLFDTEDGSPVATATVNMPDEDLADNEVIIKNYSENDGIYQCLVNAGVISKVKRYTTNGLLCPICEILI